MKPLARHRRYLSAAAALIAALWGLPGAGAAAPAVEFEWTFVTHRQTGAGWETASVQRDAPLKSGDMFKFFIHRRSPCHLYLMHLSSQGEMALLYPPRLNTAPPEPDRTDPLFLPSDGRWFKLDETTGQEKIILLAAADRLEMLESFVSRYLAADQGTERQVLLDKILAEIRRLRLKHKRFRQKAEKPAVVLGQLRGATPSGKPDNAAIAGMATVIAADGFYGRTFTIDHQ
jgi:hypothetical protein